MKLSEVGEARVRGYLFVLGQSLRTFLPGDVARDALREMESHIRERLDSAEPEPDERAAVERVLQELGPPLRVAQVYSAELTIDEALTTGRAVPTLRALWQQATTTAAGFAVSFLLFLGYTFGLSFIAIAALKPVFPGNVGLFVIDGVPHGFGALFPSPAGAEVVGGYWVIPICLGLGLAILAGTHRGTRSFLAWWRERRRESSVRAMREPRG
jgi:amino acid transporter